MRSCGKEQVEDLLESVAHIEDWEQFLLRALIFRAVTDELFRGRPPGRREDDDPYGPAVELALQVLLEEVDDRLVAAHLVR